MRVLLGLGMAVIVALSAAYAFSPRSTPALTATRIPVDRMLFTTLARAGATLVAGGELGQILWSADEGKTWQAANVEPRRYALITQIVFEGDKLGMAIGHEGQILRSDDGGKNWKELAFDKENGEPLMSIARLPSGAWLAVGAFGRALTSSAEGKTWNKAEITDAGDKHLNRIVSAKDGSRWLIFGERGFVLTSTDGAKTWSVVPPFYNGSLYGAVQLDDGSWVAYGMRGNAYRAGPDAQSWTKSTVPAPISMFGHAKAADGSLLLVGQGGIVLQSRDGGAKFNIVRGGGRAALTDIALLSDGHWLLPSDGGMHRHDPTKVAAAAAPASGAK